MEEPELQHEQLHRTQLRIYVASLSDYNDGRLHGRWIDADQEPEAIAASIDDMLHDSPLAGAEEWAIHDYEGFGVFQLSEYEDLSTVSRIANGIGEHGPAFAHWANVVGTEDDEALDDFGDHYLGAWESLEDYARDLLEDLGVDSEQIGPAWLRPYVRIDYEQLAADLSTDLEIAEDASGVHLFTSR